MKLQNFLKTTTKYDWKAVAADKELTRQIQQRLIDLGLLEPPVDGSFGPVTTFALQRFQTQLQCGEPGFLGAVTAEKLIEAKAGNIPVQPLIIKTLQGTFFKLRPIDSSDLPESQKQAIEEGRQFELIAFQQERNHLRITLRKDSFKNSKIWYAYGLHVAVFQKDLQVYPKSVSESITQPKGTSKPKTVKLRIPYKSQLDNYYNPTGACNVTSMAMCMEFLGVKRRSNVGQFEDELYQYALNKSYSRWDPYDLAKIVREYGCKDTFKEKATIEEVKDWVADGKPAVIHGYFTSFGHIMPVIGYDETGFFVNDPYGEWFADGYDNNASGAGLHYSYSLIRRTCIPDGDFWVHFISK